MRRRPKDHTIGAEVYSTTDRRSRALALGECALQVMENFHKLQKEREESRHPLIEGSLFWMLKEDKVKDTDGKKGFRYRVMLKVQSQEPYYTEDEIREELHKTYLQFKAETEEMFGETTDEEYLEGERTNGLSDNQQGGVREEDQPDQVAGTVQDQEQGQSAADEQAALP